MTDTIYVIETKDFPDSEWRIHKDYGFYLMYLTEEEAKKYIEREYGESDRKDCFRVIPYQRK